MIRKIDPAHIGFDIDGVVADTGGAFVRIASEEYGINSISLEDITSFEVVDCLHMDQDIIEEIFGRLLNDPLLAGLQPMQGAITVLHSLAEKAPLTFVTARPDEEPIARWLKHFLQPAIFAKIRLVAMGVHDKKTSYIKDLGLKYFVDDRLQTCRKLAEAGITPLVYNQPWNKIGHNLPTVNNWQDIQALCAD
jgi:uncharacterized HAD superfamily protein